MLYSDLTKKIINSIIKPLLNKHNFSNTNTSEIVKLLENAYLIANHTNNDSLFNLCDKILLDLITKIDINNFSIENRLIEVYSLITRLQSRDLIEQENEFVIGTPILFLRGISFTNLEDCIRQIISILGLWNITETSIEGIILKDQIYSAFSLIKDDVLAIQKKIRPPLNKTLKLKDNTNSLFQFLKRSNTYLDFIFVIRQFDPSYIKVINSILNILEDILRETATSLKKLSIAEIEDRNTLSKVALKTVLLINRVNLKLTIPYYDKTYMSLQEVFINKSLSDNEKMDLFLLKIEQNPNEKTNLTEYGTDLIDLVKKFIFLKI